MTWEVWSGQPTSGQVRSSGLGRSGQVGPRSHVGQVRSGRVVAKDMHTRTADTACLAEEAGLAERTALGDGVGG